MSRSVWKGPFVDASLQKKVVKHLNDNSNQIIKTWSRRSTILPDFVGITFSVHRGDVFVPVTVMEEMVGRKLGEFAPTRKFHGHGADKKVKKK